MEVFSVLQALSRRVGSPLSRMRLDDGVCIGAQHRNSEMRLAGVVVEELWCTVQFPRHETSVQLSQSLEEPCKSILT